MYLSLGSQSVEQQFQISQPCCLTLLVQFLLLFTLHRAEKSKIHVNFLSKMSLL